MKGFFKAGKTIWIIAYAEHASHRFHRTHALRQSVSHTIQPFTTSFAFPKQTHITKPKHNYAALDVSRTMDNLARRPDNWRSEPTPSDILICAKPVSLINSSFRYSGIS